VPFCSQAPTAPCPQTTIRAIPSGRADQASLEHPEQTWDTRSDRRLGGEYTEASCGHVGNDAGVKWGWGNILSAVSVALLLGGCTSNVICAGQCSAPYELDVTFAEGTSIPTAKAVLQRCGHNPEVVSVGVPKVEDGRVGAVIRTHDFLRSTKTEPLLTCLYGSGSVGSAGWPD